MVLHRTRLLTALAVCVSAALIPVPQALAAGPAVNKKVAAEVPAAYKQKGTLVVAADATYAPTSSSPRTGRR